MSFWRSRLEIDNGVFANAHYEEQMLAIAQERDQSFMKGKVVADFGCGPRGSLAWAKEASLRIGIDVLSDQYADEFGSNITSHEMIYVKSTEKVIPIPSNCVDIMITMNAMDHVDDLDAMCSEVLRVLKPGGEFIGSFNVEEPPSSCEPQELTEKKISEKLLKFMTVDAYRVARPGPEGNKYGHLMEGNLSYEEGELGVLWVRAKKGSASG